jgi:3-dehydroquinate synthetase
LPTVNEIPPFMMKDKKNHSGVISYALIDKIGSATYDQVVDVSQLYEAFEDYKR